MPYVSIRIIIDTIILLSFFFLPWWCAAILACLALLYFDVYAEIAVFGTVLDLLNGSGTGWHHYQFLAASIILFSIVSIVRKYMRV